MAHEITTSDPTADGQSLMRGFTPPRPSPLTNDADAAGSNPLLLVVSRKSQLAATAPPMPPPSPSSSSSSRSSRRLLPAPDLPDGRTYRGDKASRGEKDRGGGDEGRGLQRGGGGARGGEGVGTAGHGYNTTEASAGRLGGAALPCSRGCSSGGTTPLLLMPTARRCVACCSVSVCACTRGDVRDRLQGHHCLGSACCSVSRCPPSLSLLANSIFVVVYKYFVQKKRKQQGR